MPGYNGARAAFTPSLTADNFSLEASAAGEVAKVRSIGWGGELTTSTGYRTRWANPSTVGVGALTAIAPGRHSPAQQAALLEFGAGYATTEPVLPTATDLFLTSWNAHGGIGYVALPLANPWDIVNGVTAGDALSCRNLAGVDANGSSYQVEWEE